MFRFIAAALAVIAFATLLAGITLPLLTVTSLYIFSQSPSILNLVGGLWTAEERLLSIIVATFAIVFPLAKLGVVAWALTVNSPTRALHWFERIGKWSMLDVLIVATVIVTIKITGLQDARTEAGLFAFIGCVVLTAASAALARRATADKGEIRQLS